MFGRQRSQQTPVTAVETKAGGKGRPTPTRREAEGRNRRPLVSGGRAASLKPGATRAERKAARQAQRVAAQADRSRSRQALLTGDERNLPARDQGPGRRFARDYVDARRNIGEVFMPFAVVVLLLSLIRIPIAQFAALLALYGVGLVVIVDVYLLRRRINRLVTERLGADAARGVGTYALMRSLQIRRTRLPRPQVKRGQYPG